MTSPRRIFLQGAWRKARARRRRPFAASRAAELRERLLVWIASESNAYRPQKLSPETQEELKALGYAP